MNGKKAKELRRAVYGDQPLRQDREYGVFKKVFRLFASKDAKEKGEAPAQTVERLTVINKGTRAEYQQAKKHAGDYV
jgi:hypothetical protein